MSNWDPASALLFVVSLAALALKIWALVDCCVRPADAFPAASKLTKVAWLAILAVAVLIGLYFGALGLLGLVSLVTAIVYLVDVRPAVRSMRSGGPWG